MFLELLTLGVAADADSNARQGSGYAKQARDAALGTKDGTFVVFDEVDYTWKWDSAKWYKSIGVSTGKVLTRHSIPASRIKEMIEVENLEWDNNNNYSTQWNRLSAFHKGKLVVIETFDDMQYYLEGSLEQLGKNNKE